MRRAFLDSQVAFWLATGSPNLSKQTLKTINGFSSTSISSLTIAELEMKAAIGKLPLPQNLGEVFEKAGIQVESFDAIAAGQLRRFGELSRHDPFDRMILAQASSRIGTTLFTADEALLGLGLDWVVGV